MAVQNPIPGALRVAPSPVAGRGVFANRPFEKGDRLIEYTGVVRKEKDDETTPYGHTFLFRLSRGRVIDPTEGGGNESMYINHSCAPNCEAVGDDDHIFIDAIRPIQQDEELFFDYRLDLGRTPTKADKEEHRCRCGSPKCRGTLLWIPRKKKKTAAQKAAKKGIKKSVKKSSSPSGKKSVKTAGKTTGGKTGRKSAGKAPRKAGR